MQVSVVCWSRANDKNLLLWFLKSLEAQTFTDFDVNIVCDRRFTKEEESDFSEFFNKQELRVLQSTRFLTHNNCNFDPAHVWWASYVRNFWLQQASGEFILLLDDDDRIAPTFLEQCLDKRSIKTKETKVECVILPSLYFRDSEHIQNQWFSRFNYLQSRPELYLLHGKQESQVQMFSGNWIFGKAVTLRKKTYDEQIARISEDLDYTLSLYEGWVQLRVFSDLKVQHFEREKTILEQARIWSQAQARQKSRNRFLFTKKHGTKHNLFQFYMCWLPWCIIWLSIKAIRFWWSAKRKIIKGIFEWVKEWRTLVSEKK